jgi:hypothetical protein
MSDIELLQNRIAELNTKNRFLERQIEDMLIAMDSFRLATHHIYLNHQGYINGKVS